MARIPLSIEALVRTNSALVFLCIISIGVLFLIFRSPESAIAPVSSLSIQIAPVSSADIQKSDQSVLLPELFRNMPLPNTFDSFVYAGEEVMSVSITCTDIFSVILIFPQEIDYRYDVLSARYNSALPCNLGEQKTIEINLRGFGFQVGKTYYTIRASQGQEGLWHNPY